MFSRNDQSDFEIKSFIWLKTLHSYKLQTKFTQVLIREIVILEKVILLEVGLEIVSWLHNQFHSIIIFLD